MVVKICIKGDLEHNKKMADIIEDICPYPLPTHYLIQHYSFKIFRRSWLVFCQERKPWTLKILNCDQSQQTKLAARKQARKTTTVVECCFKFPTPDWLFPCNTITFQKYFRCLWFYEFHDKSPAKSSIFIRLGNSLNWWYKMYCNSKKGRRLEIIQKETKN